jgi:hypothetical protein
MLFVEYKDTSIIFYNVCEEYRQLKLQIRNLILDVRSKVERSEDLGRRN